MFFNLADVCVERVISSCGCACLYMLPFTKLCFIWHKARSIRGPNWLAIVYKQAHLPLHDWRRLGMNICVNIFTYALYWWVFAYEFNREISVWFSTTEVSTTNNRAILGMILNCILWWGSSSGALGSVDHYFIAITPWSTLDMEKKNLLGTPQ